MAINDERMSAFQRIFTDRPIAYHPMIAKAVGSVTAGVLLSQLAYWDPRGQEQDGWIYKTQAQLYEETGLTRWEQENARRYLRDAGLLEEQKRGLPAKLYFRINLDRLEDLVATPKDEENPHPSMRETNILVRGKPTDKRAENPQASHIETESTSENTSGTITESIQPSTSKDSMVPDNLKVRIEQISRALGDAKATRSNVTRAARIASEYEDLSSVLAALEDAFYATTQRQDTLEKPMAYLFETWVDHLKSIPKGRARLSGRYAHLVKH